MYVETFSFPDGHQWYYGEVETLYGEVLVPTQEIENLSDEQIGQHVRQVAQIARIVTAISTFQQHYLDRVSDEYLEWGIARLQEGLTLPPFPYQSECQSALDGYLNEKQNRQIEAEKQAQKEARKEAQKAKKHEPNPGYVYLVQSPTGTYKIGRAKNVSDRMSMFHVKLPFEIALLHTIECRNYHTAESELHARYASKRVNGEWFSLDDQDVADIKAIERM